MIQLANDLHQALELFIQIDELIQGREVENQFVDRPAVLPLHAELGAGEVQMTVQGSGVSDAHRLLWSCGLFLEEGFEDETEEPIQAYRAFIEVVLSRRSGELSGLTFIIRCIVSDGKEVWNLRYPTSEEVIEVIETNGTRGIKERFQMADRENLDRQLAMDLISVVLPFVGGSKHPSDRPPPVTLPSPGAEAPEASK